jgi:N-glycosylase/DNA lyase
MSCIAIKNHFNRLMPQRSFIEVWRAVAQYLNRLVFNDIATEALFTRVGAKSLAADVAAMASAFRYLFLF